MVVWITCEFIEVPRNPTLINLGGLFIRKILEMLGSLTLFILLPILLVVAVYITKEILGKRNLKFYTDQGVVADYVPITGALKHVHPSPEPSKDPFRSYFDFFKKHEKNPHSMVVTNTFYTT